MCVTVPNCIKIRLTVFQNGDRTPFWICWVCNWTTYDEQLVVFTCSVAQKFAWNLCHMAGRHKGAGLSMQYVLNINVTLTVQLL